MDKLQQPAENTSTPCPWCGGSGQSSFFGGESRFMFTWEDCPDCCGTGVVLDDTDPDPASQGKKRQDPPSSR